jgi:hypothetical protein
MHIKHQGWKASTTPRQEWGPERRHKRLTRMICAARDSRALIVEAIAPLRDQLKWLRRAGDIFKQLGNKKLKQIGLTPLPTLTSRIIVWPHRWFPSWPCFQPILVAWGPWKRLVRSLETQETLAYYNRLFSISAGPCASMILRRQGGSA